MPTKFPEFFAALGAPFENVKTLNAGNGRSLSYITARAVMNRLDDVVGPEGWFDRYTPVEKGVLCELTITLPDGSQITKSDVGGYAGMEERKGGNLIPDEENDVKSAYSDALKRAAVKFAVGRHLYNDGVPNFCVDAAPARYSSPPQQQQRPQYASASPSNPAPQRSAPPPTNAASPSSRDFGPPPKHGKGLFAFCKKMQEQHGVDFVRTVSTWGKGQEPEFPFKMYDWAPDQIALGFAEVVRQVNMILDEKEGVSSGSGTNGSETPLAKAIREFNEVCWEIAAVRARGKNRPATEADVQAIREEIDPESGEVVDPKTCTDLALLARHTKSAKAILADEVPY